MKALVEMSIMMLMQPEVGFFLSAGFMEVIEDFMSLFYGSKPSFYFAFRASRRSTSVCISGIVRFKLYF
jgi:hypothetical protein